MTCKYEIMKILTLINLMNCWTGNPVGHPAGLFVTLMYIYLTPHVCD